MAKKLICVFLLLVSHCGLQFNRNVVTDYTCTEKQFSKAKFEMEHCYQYKFYSVIHYCYSDAVLRNCTFKGD